MLNKVLGWENEKSRRMIKIFNMLEPAYHSGEKSDTDLRSLITSKLYLALINNSYDKHTDRQTIKKRKIIRKYGGFPEDQQKGEYNYSVCEGHFVDNYQRI